MLYRFDDGLGWRGAAASILISRGCHIGAATQSSFADAATLTSREKRMPPRLYRWRTVSSLPSATIALLSGSGVTSSAANTVLREHVISLLRKAMKANYKRTYEILRTSH